jgi:uncharacterized protein with ParB-like and HNH nuclease domain
MDNIASAISLKKLLAMNISIPVYQRPYKWSTENTEALLNDLKKAMDERYSVPYVMGTIIVSEKNSKSDFEIVDGQQRLTTLSILLYKLNSLEPNSLLEQEYKHIASKKNIIENYRHISNWLFRKNIDDIGSYSL